MLDVVLGLRSDDREVLDHLRQALAQRGPVGARLAGSSDDFRLGPARGREVVASHVADDGIVLADVLLRLAARCAASCSLSLRHSLRTSIKEFSCSPRPDIRRSTICCCRASSSSTAAPLHVFLSGAGRGRGGILGLAVEGRQERAGLVEVSRHGLPGRPRNSRSRSF